MAEPCSICKNRSVDSMCASCVLSNWTAVEDRTDCAGCEHLETYADEEPCASCHKSNFAPEAKEAESNG
jgi:hypothetical protein